MELEIVAKQIRGFIAERFPLARDISNDDRLLQRGVIDSLGVLEVVAFLERDFHIAVMDEELLPENFQSISRLAAFVYTKQNGTPHNQ